MAGLNFGSLKNTSGISSNKPMLKPWGIYNVTLTSVEISEFDGKKDPSKHYKTLKVRFDAKEGYYTETIFFPESEKDTERQTYQNSEGHDYQVASNFDRAMAFVAQLAATVNPEGWAKMQEVSDKFKSFEDVAKALIKITSPKFGKFQTNLKLVGRTSQGAIIATLPKFCAINKDGESFIADNFIGESVGFTPYEEGRRNAYLNAAPTAMADSTEDVTIDTKTEEEEDFNLDDIDLN